MAGESALAVKAGAEYIFTLSALVKGPHAAALVDLERATVMWKFVECSDVAVWRCLDKPWCVCCAFPDRLIHSEDLFGESAQAQPMPRVTRFRDVDAPIEAKTIFSAPTVTSPMGSRLMLMLEAVVSLPLKQGGVKQVPFRLKVEVHDTIGIITRCRAFSTQATVFGGQLIKQAAVRVAFAAAVPGAGAVAAMIPA